MLRWLSQACIVSQWRKADREINYCYALGLVTSWISNVLLYYQVHKDNNLWPLQIFPDTLAHFTAEKRLPVRPEQGALQRLKLSLLGEETVHPCSGQKPRWTSWFMCILKQEGSPHNSLPPFSPQKWVCSFSEPAVTGQRLAQLLCLTATWAN